MVETNIEALEAAQARFPGLGITDAVDGGACDGCGDDEVTIYRMDVETDGWCCMTCTVAAAFENLDDNEFLKFDRVTDRLSNRPDLHAFLPWRGAAIVARRRTKENKDGAKAHTACT